NLALDENLISNEYAVKLCLDYEMRKGKKLVKKELIVALKGELYFGNGEALAIKISQKFALLEEERPVIETMAYHDKYKKILDEIRKDKVELDGKTVKQDEDAVGVTTLIAKFLILDILIDHDAPIVVGRGFLRTIGSMINTSERIFSTFDGFCHQTFRAARSDFLRNAESDGDDEEEYVIKRNKFRAPIYGPKPAPYLNCTNPEDLPLKQVNWKPEYKGSYTKGEEARGQWRTEIRITDPYGNVYLQGFTTKNTDRKLSKYHNREAKSRYNTRLAQLFHRHIYSPCVMNWDILNRMGCDGVIDDHEEIFTSVAWIRAYNINEQIYAGLCHEFYSTYEFDEVCANDELQTKKIIKFRLGGRSHNLTLLEFARTLGLYQATELDEDRFNVYFEGGLRSDEHFNTHEYWMSIGREESLSFSMSHASTIRFPILRVIHKIITYGLCQRTTGYDKIQKNDLWLLSMFDTRHQNGYANVAWLIKRWMKRK
ncbi:hypothetical protein Tco_0775179, partial [Tanacetum coccineum]